MLKLLSENESYNTRQHIYYAYQVSLSPLYLEHHLCYVKPLSMYLDVEDGFLVVVAVPFVLILCSCSVCLMLDGHHMETRNA